MPESDVELAEAKVKLRKDGTLVQSQDGKEVVVATYSRTTGHLEFATKDASVKLYQQITARIGTVNNGTEESGLKIKSMGVKGETQTESPATKRPKMGPEGDCTPEVVDWYVNNALSEAIIRYGIYTDSKGKPIKRHVKRIIESTIDQRNMRDDKIPWVESGNRTQDKSPIARRHEIIELKSAIIARRATRYDEESGCVALFTPKEVVGGMSLNDDGEPEVDQ